MKPCGHVVCKTCTDTLVKPAKQCIQCDVQLADKDIIELAREGPYINRSLVGLLTPFRMKALDMQLEDWRRRRRRE